MIVFVFSYIWLLRPKSEIRATFEKISSKRCKATWENRRYHSDDNSSSESLQNTKIVKVWTFFSLSKHLLNAGNLSQFNGIRIEEDHMFIPQNFAKSNPPWAAISYFVNVLFRLTLTRSSVVIFCFAQISHKCLGGSNPLKCCINGMMHST